MASCNKIWGKFSIKGTSIRFGAISTTRNTCDQQEEEYALLQVLREAVSNYSVTKPTLLLRNGSGVVVFEATRL
jgi:heat shock protein HslJ